MTLPKVSVVVTVKNEEENIAALLDSLLKLDYSGEIEVLVVDGGSDDRTVEIVSRYPDVKLITAKCNASQGRNIGIENASGEIVAFTDGDCVADRDWIRNIVKHFDERSEIAAVGGPYSPTSQRGLIPQFLAVYESVYFPSRSGFTTHERIGTGNIAFRREVVEKAGGFDEQLVVGEDVDLNLRVSRLGYKLFFAEDVKVRHKFRTTLREASRYAFEHGKAYSLFNRKHKKYRELLFPYTRTLLIAAGVLLVITILSGNLILAGVELALLLAFFYLSKLVFPRRTPYQPRTSLKTRLAIPLIDLYLRIIDSLGSVAGLIESGRGLHSASQSASSQAPNPP